MKPISAPTQVPISAIDATGAAVEWRQQFLADVRDIVDGRCQPADFESNRPSFQESLVSTAVIEAVNQSLVRGEAWVDVEDVVTKPVAAQPASR